jgi:glucose-6-phosphate 1-dehydrogenase
MTRASRLPTQVLIFGGTGDLARRKLVPALARLAQSGRVGATLQVVGIGRRPLSDDAFRAALRDGLAPADASAFDALAPRVHYATADVEHVASLERLRTTLDALAGGGPVARLCYLALAPRLFAFATELLCAAGILHRQDRNGGAFRRIVVEKPFGRDFASAHALNEALHRVLDEHQVFRIDHYLGKETVQNLLGLRFHNAIFEPVWNRHHVELVQVTVAETIGVEDGRAGFYEGTGALRDVLQNHVLQVLSLVAMEAPASLDADALRNQKVEVLRSLRAPDTEEVARHSVRGRYAAGAIDGEPVRAYLDEDGVPRDSSTETFVAVRAEIDNWRWQGVPFLLRHGKRMARRVTEVRVQFRMPPVQLFNRPAGMSDAELQRQLRAGALCLVRPNVLTIRIQPDEAIGLSFGVKRPGPEMVMAPASLAFDYRQHFGGAPADAYERLLQDALNGDAALFLRADETEASWRFCDAVLEAWQAPGLVPLHDYPAGSWGPPQADALFYGCEGGWANG